MQKIQSAVIDLVSLQYDADGFVRINGDISGNQPNANIRCVDQRLQQGHHAGKKACLVPVNLGEGMDQLFAVFLTKLAMQILGEFAQSSQVFQQLAPPLEALQIADIHAVKGEGAFHRMK